MNALSTGSDSDAAAGAGAGAAGGADQDTGAGTGAGADAGPAPSLVIREWERSAEQDLEREQEAFSSSTDPAPGMYLRQIPTGTEVIDVEAEVLEGLEVVEVD